MAFPGSFPGLGADRPSRSYASPVLGGGNRGIGGVRVRDGVGGGDDPSRRKAGHRPSNSTSTSYLPSAPRPDQMFLIRAPPVIGGISGGTLPSANAPSAGIGMYNLPDESSSTLPSFNATGGTSGGGGGGAGLGFGGASIYKGKGGGGGFGGLGNPDDLLVLPSMLPRTKSDGTLPATSLQMQSIRQPSKKNNTGLQRLTGTRYHGPTLASPPNIMGTPGYGLSMRDKKTGMTESERIRADYLAAGREGGGGEEPASGAPKKKKKKRVAEGGPSSTPGTPDLGVASSPQPGTGAQLQSPPPPPPPQQTTRSQSQPQSQDAFLSWPGHTALGVVIPTNSSSANLPLPIASSGNGSGTVGPLNPASRPRNRDRERDRINAANVNITSITNSNLNNNTTPTEVETPEARKARRRASRAASGTAELTSQERRERRYSRRASRRYNNLQDGAGNGGSGGGGGGGAEHGNGNRMGRDRSGSGNGNGEGGLFRGASMRRTNVWDEVPEAEDAATTPLPDAPPSFPYPTPSTTRLPPSYLQSTSVAEQEGRSRSPPPGFEETLASHALVGGQTDSAMAGSNQARELGTLHEEEEDQPEGMMTHASKTTAQEDEALSETASSVEMDDETPEKKRKREMRKAWVEDSKTGMGLEERIKRAEERLGGKPDSAVQEIESARKSDMVSQIPEPVAKAITVQESESKQLSTNEEDLEKDLEEEDKHNYKRFSRAEKGKGRAVEVASINDIPPLSPVTETPPAQTPQTATFPFRARSTTMDGTSTPGTPGTPDIPIDRPVDMESIAETHGGSDSEGDFVSVKEGISAPNSEVKPSRLGNLENVDINSPEKSPVRVSGWRQVDEPDLAAESTGKNEMPLLGQVVGIKDKAEEMEEVLTPVTPVESPAGQDLTRTTAMDVPVTPSQSTVLANASTPIARARATTIDWAQQDSATPLYRVETTGSKFVEDLPEVNSAETRPRAASSAQSIAPVPPVKDAISTPTSTTSINGPKPLFKRAASDKVANENPWAFMRRVSSSTKTGGSDKINTDIPIKPSPLAVESPKASRPANKLSRLASQLFRPNLGLVPGQMSPGKEAESTPSISEGESEEEGVMVDKPAAELPPSRQAALARRDLLAPLTRTNTSPSLMTTETTQTAAYIHPFNRAVKPAWMVQSAKFNLPIALDPAPSRKYAAPDGENLENRLGWTKGKPLVEQVRPEDLDRPLAPPPSWPVMAEAVSARRRAPPPVPVRASPQKDASDSEDDDDDTDSDSDGSSSYEWSISDVVPRRSGGYRLLPPKGLPAEVLRGPAEPHPHYRREGEDRVRPRGPRNRGEPPPLPPRTGRSTVASTVVKAPEAPVVEVPPKPVLKMDVPNSAIVAVSGETPTPPLPSPLPKQPQQPPRRTAAEELHSGILASLIPSPPEARNSPAPEVSPPPEVEDMPAMPAPAKKRANGVRAKESAPTPALRPGRLVIKPRFDDRPEQEMQSQLSKRVNKWRVSAVGAEVTELIQEIDPDSEPEVAAPPAPHITHSRSAPNVTRLGSAPAATAALDSPRPPTTASTPNAHQPDVASPSPALRRQAEAGPSTPRELEYTDLDLAVARATENGRDFEAIGEATAFIDNAGQGATAEELADLLIAPVELESRRTTKDGKVKLKLSALGVRVTKCAICQLQYKEGHMLAMMPNCGHTGHQKCVVGWLRSDARCMICRQPLRS